MAPLASSQVHVSAEHLGLARLDPVQDGAIELVNDLLQQNHDKFHMYFRNVAGHNHIPHSLLSVLAMGGSLEQIHRAYDDGEKIQRPIPSVDPKIVESLGDPAKFQTQMLELDQYTNFLVFFEQEIEAKGYKSVLNEYLFSGTPLAECLLSQLYEGLYHPIIHVAFGIEFDQPSIVAEGLAHAASHDPGRIDELFLRSEKLARSGTVKRKSLRELYDEVRANEHIRSAARIQDGPNRGKGVLIRAMDELVNLTAQYQVTPEELQRATVEMISCGAFTSAAQKAGKVRKIDFFYLHLVTCSLSVDVMMRQDWIKIEDRVRILEWKGRLDLVWYAANGAAEMKADDINDYEPTLSKGMDWRSMYKAVNDIHDDGHVVKFVRALKNGEDVAKPYENAANSENGVPGGASDFPVKGDMWFKIAQICYDSTVHVVNEDINQLSKKWVWGAGFELAWMKIPDLE